MRRTLPIAAEEGSLPVPPATKRPRAQKPNKVEIEQPTLGFTFLDDDTLKAVRRDFPGWDVHALKAEFDTWVAGGTERAPRDYQKAFYGFVKQHHARHKHELR